MSEPKPLEFMINDESLPLPLVMVKMRELDEFIVSDALTFRVVLIPAISEPYLESHFKKCRMGTVEG